MLPGVRSPVGLSEGEAESRLESREKRGDDVEQLLTQ